MPESYIARTAEALLANAGALDAPIDLVTVARYCGLSIRPVPGAPNFSGRLVPEQFVIEVNQVHHPHRQRFTIGHELGHFELKHSGVVCVQDSRSWSDPTRINERQANEFSAALLMPADLVRAAWRELAHNGKVAERFNVSDQAMWLRLEALDLLGLDRPL